jgi:hypothetical protein
LVSNPANDDVISWTANGMTFTVWKPDVLEENFLPETFKHSNFASFVRQLNNYGFRKCHSDRFEFGVQGFEKNKPELLTTLKRNEAPRIKAKKETTAAATTKEKETKTIKSSSSAMMKALPGIKGSGSGSGSVAAAAAAAEKRSVGRAYKEGNPTGGHSALELGAFGDLTEEVDQLKRDRMVLLKEVMRLRLEQDDTQTRMRMLEQRTSQNEQFSAQMRSLLETLQQNPKLAQDFGEQLNNVSSRFAPRKRRQAIPLLGGGENNNSIENDFNNNNNNNNNKNNNNNRENERTQMHLDVAENHASNLRLQEIMDEREEREPSPKLFPNGNFALVPTPDKETGLAQFTWQEIMEANTPSNESTESLRKLVNDLTNEEEMMHDENDDEDPFISSILDRTNSAAVSQDLSDILPTAGSLSLSFLDSEEMTNLVKMAEESNLS